MYVVFDMKGVIVTETDDLEFADIVTDALQVARQSKHFLMEAGSLTGFNEGRWTLKEFGQGPLSTKENHLFEI